MLRLNTNYSFHYERNQNVSVDSCRVTAMPVTAADAKDPAGKLRASSVPWRKMMLTPAVWAIVVNNYTFHYAFYVVMNWLPTYFEQVKCLCIAYLFNTISSMSQPT